MSALLRAELLKLRSTRTTTGLLVATLAFVVLTVVFSVPKAGDPRAPLPLGDPDVVATTVGIAFGVPQVLVVLLGGMAFTQEFRYGTIALTYLGEPRRSRILTAKLLAAALAGVVVSLATLAVAVPLTVVLVEARGADAYLGPQLWWTAAASTAVMVAYAVIGVAVGGLVRNQIAAAVGVLVWMLAVEHIVLPAYPVVGRWLPIGATSAVQHLDRAIGLEGELLPAAAGALVLLGYAVAAVALATRLAQRTDVL